MGEYFFTVLQIQRIGQQSKVQMLQQKEDTEMNHIPRTERRWVTIRSKEKENYHVITSKNDSRSRYYLYNCQDGMVTKLGSARSPIELEDQWPL